MIHFICFADENYHGQQGEIIAQAKKWFDTTTGYNENDIAELREGYPRAFSSLKNAGCIWKPYIILDKLSKVDEGDIVFYSDCGDDISTVNDYATLIKGSMMKDVFLITCGYRNDHYTKEYCFYKMGCTDEKYRLGNHLEAGQCGFVRTYFNIKFVMEWLIWCKNLDVLLDDEMGMKNSLCHRHSRDQSILTNLQIKYDLPVHDVSHIYGRYVFFNTRG